MKATKHPRATALCLAILMTLPLLLCACSGSTGADGVSIPNGTQSAAAGEASYYMFVPSDWIVERYGETTMVTVSAYSSVSISMTSFASDKTPEAYWEESRADFARVLSDFRTETTADELMDDAPCKRFRFFGKYEGGTEYGFMQCIAKKGERLYVLTFTAAMTEFAEYEKSVDGILSYFKFKKSDSPAEKPTEITEGAPEGMKQISRTDIHSYRFFVPISWVTLRQDGLVAACVSDTDRTTVSITSNYPPSGVSSIAEYFASMESKRQSMLADYRLISGGEKEDEADIAGKRGAKYVYEGKNGGIEYRITQIFFVRGSNIYTLTYSATKEASSTHADAFASICAALNFGE